MLVEANRNTIQTLGHEVFSLSRLARTYTQSATSSEYSPSAVTWTVGENLTST